MFTRKRFTWKCVILDQHGKQIQREISSFWSPEKVSPESIALACASRESGIINHGTKPYLPVSAALVG